MIRSVHLGMTYLSEIEDANAVDSAVCLDASFEQFLGNNSNRSLSSWKLSDVMGMALDCPTSCTLDVVLKNRSEISIFLLKNLRKQL